MKFKYKLVLLTFGLLLANFAFAGKHLIEQKNKTFTSNGKTIGEYVIKKGDVVTFRNSDKIKHSIFSLSDAKLFDLGSTKPGISKDIVFEKAGQVDIECSVHSEMYLKLIVK